MLSRNGESECLARQTLIGSQPRIRLFSNLTECGTSSGRYRQRLQSYTYEILDSRMRWGYLGAHGAWLVLAWLIAMVPAPRSVLRTG